MRARELVDCRARKVGTAVNVARVGCDLLVMSIIHRAALYRAPEATTEATS